MFGLFKTEQQDDTKAEIKELKEKLQEIQRENRQLKEENKKLIKETKRQWKIIETIMQTALPETKGNENNNGIEWRP